MNQLPNNLIKGSKPDSLKSFSGGVKLDKYILLTKDTKINSYLRMPRFLISMKLSNEAKVLYALLLDRASISIKNGFFEPSGAVRVYFTLEEAKDKLHKSRQVTTRIFRELEMSGLIIRKRQGQGRPSLITLKVPKEEPKAVRKENKRETRQAS